MTKTSSILFLFFVLMVCKAEAKTELLLVGDSWAVFHCTTHSFQKAFREHKIKNVRIRDCANTTTIGAKASSWLKQKESQKTVSYVSRAKVLYLSLGGNDFLNRWNKNMTGTEEQTLRDQVCLNLSRILDYYLSLNPQLKIVLSGYDFANFVEFTEFKAYKRLFENMGRPSPVEINTAFLRLSETLLRLADQKRIFFIHHYGVLHYWYGSKKHNLAPRSTLPPENISTPDNPLAFGGDLNLEADKSAMLHIPLVLRDPFHLSARAYQYLADHSIQIWLKDLLNSKP